MPHAIPAATSQRRRPGTDDDCNRPDKEAGVTGRRRAVRKPHPVALSRKQAMASLGRRARRNAPIKPGSATKHGISDTTMRSGSENSESAGTASAKKGTRADKTKAMSATALVCFTRCAADSDVSCAGAIERPNDIEFTGEKEGAQRLTPSPVQ